ncbi:MAG TPA: hypothetical protein VGR89_17210 [Puia sp.]|nr:hypothetical protein [Puia sp.]
MLLETMEVTADRGSKDDLMNIPPAITPGNYFLRLSRRGGIEVRTRKLVVL